MEQEPATPAITRDTFMQIDAMQAQLLAELSGLLRELENRVPAPRLEDGHFRYGSAAPQQCRVAVLARMMSSLQSQRLLVNAGQAADALACGRLFDTLLAKVLDRDAEERGWLPVRAHWQVDERELMSTYMEPGPHFQVDGVMGSVPWYEAYDQLLRRLSLLLCAFRATAVAFGHPGMSQYVEDCRKSFEASLRRLRPAGRSR